jgi:OOP family OmpA-OmpF porin
MKLRVALLAATVMAVPLIAKAQPINGLYVGGGIGLNVLQDETVNHSAALGTPNTMAMFNAGYVGELNVGYGLGALNSALSGFRVELEGNYIDNSMQSNNSGANPMLIKGSQDSYGALVNILYDIDPNKLGLNEHLFYPYVGLGAG